MAEPEQRLAEALRAHASGGGWTGAPRTAPPPPGAAHSPRPLRALLVALAAGLVLGVALAMVSLLAPGVLPG